MIEHKCGKTNSSINNLILYYNTTIIGFKSQQENKIDNNLKYLDSMRFNNIKSTF